ncbi:hypothetical protein [Paenibacillus gorillae]|uniref:hypothetical protein n=1 Tax=Paenibacillus gorillae TaxID=1243662 RepID=UPI0005AB8C1F|nr:hypothetical protein [Paenibacillus gorillae]
MKVISVMQSWAQLIVLKEKWNETRNWATKHRGPLAIHASKKIDKAACELEPIRSVLAKHRFHAGNLPTGAIIGTTILDDCHKVTANDGESALVDPGILVVGNEFYFGDYSIGRYAWSLLDIKRLAPPPPIPVKGKLSLREHPIDTGNRTEAGCCSDKQFT